MSASAKMDAYLTGKPNHIFDDFPHDYYTPPLDEGRSRALSQVTMAFATLGAMLGDHKGVYLACAISSGMRGAAVVEQVKGKFIEADIRPTTVKLGEFAGSEYVSQQVFKPNIDKNMAMIPLARQHFPDQLVIAPAGLEAFVHVTAKQPAFSRGQRWEEEDYRAWWFPVIDHHINTLVISSDLNFSRVGTEEIMRGTLVQAGLIPARPKADMAVVDIAGNPVTLADRAETIADYLRWAAPRGHDVGISATALTRLCYLSDQIEAARQGEESVIDYGKINKALKKRTPVELEKIAAIKASMGPFIADYAAGQLNPVDLPPDYVADFLAGKPGVPMAEAMDSMKPFQAVLETIELMTPLPFQRMNALPGRQYQHDGDYFGPSRRAAIFDDHLYQQATTERERVTLSFVMAAAETAMPPASADHVTFVIADAKTGPASVSGASVSEIENLAELPGVQGRDFAKIDKKNRQLAQQTIQNIRQQNKNKLVYSSFDVRQIADSVASVPEAVVAPGPARLGPAARTAFRHALMDRNVNRVVALPGWQASADGVQDMVRATLIQVGAVPRQPGHQYDMAIFDHQGKPLTLTDRIRTLADFVVPALEKNIAVPEQALGLARLIQIHDYIVDPVYRRQAPFHLVVQALDPTLGGVLHNVDQQQQVQQIRQTAAPLLEQAAHLWHPDRVQDLPEQYSHAITTAKGIQQWQTQRRSGESIRYQPTRPSA